MIAAARVRVLEHGDDYMEAHCSGYGIFAPKHYLALLYICNVKRDFLN